MRKAMDGRVVDAGLDPPFRERAAKRIALGSLGQDDHGEVMSRIRTRFRGERHRDSPNPVELGAVALDDARPGAVALLEPAKLDQPDRGTELVEAIVEAPLDDVVAVRVTAMAAPRRRCHA